MKKGMLLTPFFTTFFLASTFLSGHVNAAEICQNNGATSTTNDTTFCENLGFATTCSSCEGRPALRCPQNSSLCFCPAGGDTDSRSINLPYHDLLNGRRNTKMIVDALGQNAPAAYAASQFYPLFALENNPVLGKGRWYLPAIGEWYFDVFGTADDYCQIKNLENWDTSRIETINNTLTELEGAEPLDCYAYASELSADGNSTPANTGLTYTSMYFSSTFNTTSTDSRCNDPEGIGIDCQGVALADASDDTRNNFVCASAPNIVFGEFNNDTIRIYGINTPLEERKIDAKAISGTKACVRAFNYLKDVFPTNSGIEVGNVVYHDLSFDATGSSTTKTPVGVAVWVSDDGKSAKIVSLKNLSFSSLSAEGNFDPSHPYINNYGTTPFIFNVNNTQVSELRERMRDESYVNQYTYEFCDGDFSIRNFYSIWEYIDLLKLYSNGQEEIVLPEDVIETIEDFEEQCE